MASVRSIKRDIDYLIQEVISDSYLTIYFHPEKKNDVVKIMENTVTLRNNLVHRASHVAEKNNRRLVKKHYRQLRLDMIAGIDSLFNQISDICKK